MKQKRIIYQDRTAVMDEENLSTPSEDSYIGSVAVLLRFHTLRWTTNEAILRKNEAVSYEHQPCEPGKIACTRTKPNYRTTKIG